MPQNITSFKSDRKLINEQAKLLLSYAIEIHTTLLEILTKPKTDLTGNDYGPAKKELYDYCDEMLELATWTISRQQPMLEDLRFLVSHITSIREIKRIFDYGYSTIRYIQKNELPKSFFNKLIEPQKFVLELLVEFVGIDAKKGVDAYNNLFDGIKEFRKNRTTLILSDIESAMLTKEVEEDSKSKSRVKDWNTKAKLAIIFALRSYDRIITHLTHLIENRLYIRTGNFSIAELVNIDVLSG